MLWYRGFQERDSPAPSRLEEPYAPSWSWASISGPVSYFGRHSGLSMSRHRAYKGDTVEPLFDIPSLYTILFVTNRYGKVQEAAMQLDMRVLPVTHRWERDRELWIPGIEIQDLDINNLKTSIDVPSELSREGENSSSRSYCFVLAGKWKSREGTTVVSSEAVCLLVRQIKKNLYRRPADSRPISFSDGKAYQRVGIVRHAGSINAWEAAVPKRVIYLF